MTEPTTDADLTVWVLAADPPGSTFLNISAHRTEEIAIAALLDAAHAHGDGTLTEEDVLEHLCDNGWDIHLDQHTVTTGIAA